MIYLGQYISAMWKLHLLALVSISLGLLAVGEASAQEPSSASTPSGNDSAGQKEAANHWGAQVLTSMDCLDPSYPFIAGDLISIRVLEDRRPAVSGRISPSGEVIAPHVGSIQAAGLTAKEFALKVKARIEEKKFLPAAHVVVALDRPSPTSSKDRFGYCCDLEFVVVFGAVVKAGKYDVSEHDLTISDLIRQTGGLTAKTKAPKIQIYRKTPQGNKRILVNTQAALNEKRTEYDLFLRRDDVIIVE